MKKLIVYIAVVFLLLSCKSQQLNFTTLCGSYDGAEEISNYALSYYVELELKQDSTCTLRKTFDLSKTECIGEWYIIRGDLIEIECNKNPVLSDIEKTLQGGSFIDGNIEVKVLDKNKLKLNNIILKRKK